MHDTPTTPLPGSWLTSRLGVNPREIEELRENGELFAVRGEEEWLYPAWQFGPGGSIPAGVRNAVNGGGELSHDLRFFRIAEVEAVGGRYGGSARAGYLARGFGNSVHRPQTRIEPAPAAVAVERRELHAGPWFPIRFPRRLPFP